MSKRYQRVKAHVPVAPHLFTASPAFTPSRYQQAIFDFVQHGTGDGLVNAVAGSGKTSTLVEASRFLEIDALFVAFGKGIAEELAARLAGTRMVAKTIHSLGHGCLIRTLGKLQIDAAKYRPICKDIVFDRLSDQLNTTDSHTLVALMRDLVRFARLTLTDPKNPTALWEMVDHFGIGGDRELLKVCMPHIDEAITIGKRQAQQAKIIDFDDQVYLPAAWNLQPPQFSWVFVDEAQDLNAAQLDFVLKCRAPGGRMLFVGDEHQAIYGFSGADSASFWTIQARTHARILPLSICYRCPSSHVRLAQEIVAEIESAPTAPEGVVQSVDESGLAAELHEGDMVLCRLTAPLVDLCIRLIQKRVPARVLGKDIGRQLTNLVEDVAQLKGFDFAKFGEFLSRYEHLQETKMAQREDSEGQIEALHDRVAAVRSCHESYQAVSADDLRQQIEDLFSDEEDVVTLATVHRAKGLERDRIFLLKPEKMPLIWPKQQEWELQQEMNLRYVALTRAKRALYFVGAEVPQVAYAPSLFADPVADMPAAPVPFPQVQKCPNCHGSQWRTLPDSQGTRCVVCHPDPLTFASRKRSDAIPHARQTLLAYGASLGYPRAPYRPALAIAEGERYWRTFALHADDETYAAALSAMARRMEVAA